MSGYGFSVGSSGYDDEDRGVGFQPAVQSRAHNPTHEILRVSSQSVPYDAIIARHSASQFAQAIDFQDGQQTIADYPSGTAASGPTCTYVYDSCIDEPVMRGGSGGSRYYNRNQQYSITAVSDGGGSVVERYAYSAYGKVTIADATRAVISGSAISNRYTYTGREWDEGLSLYHYRARMYDPVSGRFCSRDPIGFEGSRWNIYTYGDGNPTKNIDPSGKSIVPPSPLDNCLSNAEDATDSLINTALKVIARQLCNCHDAYKDCLSYNLATEELSEIFPDEDFESRNCELEYLICAAAAGSRLAAGMQFIDQWYQGQVANCYNTFGP
jgi:RHS repeat-associated protein